MKNKSIWFVIIMLFIGLALRLSYAVYLRGDVPVSDASGYDAMGLNLVKYGELSERTGVPTAGRGPVYPLFLAAIYFIFGHNYFVVRAIQCIVSILTCIIIYLIGKEVFNSKTGVIAMAISAFYPYFIYYTGYLLIETVYTFLICAVILFSYKLLKKNTCKNLAVYGLLLSITVLCKSSFIILVPVFLGMLILLWGYNKTASYKRAVIIMLAALLSYSPWIVRNYMVYNEFIPFATNGGLALLHAGKLFQFQHLQQYEREKDALVSIAGERLNEIERNKNYKKEAWKFIKENPGYMAKLAILKLFKFWRVYPYMGEQYRYDVTNVLLVVLSVVFYLPILVFGILGMILSVNLWRRELFVYGVIISFTVLHMFFWSQIRYRLPIMPYMIIFAAFGIYFSGKRLELWK